MQTYILYHANCPDGFGAAYAAWKVLGNRANYIPVNHQQATPAMKKGAEVYVVDFCYPKDTLIDLSQKMNRVTVLDHHQTAEADIQSLDLSLYPNLFITFDMSKSGAVLTWEHFHQIPVPDLLYYIQDKDLWRFALPYSKEVSAALRAYEMNFELWDSFNPEELIKEGTILLRYQNQIVDKLCKDAYLTDLAGYKVPTVNSPILQSEIGNTLCKMYPKNPFAVVFFETLGKRHYSLRSVGDFDVAQVAQSFGGGGHKNAAGFTK